MGRRPRQMGNRRAKNLRTVTLQIVLNAYEHDLSDNAEKEARRYRRGDIIDVMLTPPNATRDGNDWHWDRPIGSTRFGLIHMRDVPEKRWQNMRKRFTEALLEDNLPSAERPDDDESGIARRRRWRFDIPKLATERPPKHAELTSNKETTMLFDQAGQYIYKKHYHQKDDQTQDDYNPLEESDLPEQEEASR